MSQNYDFYLLGVRMHILDNSAALRILASTWFIFAIVIYTTYTTNLISMLAVPDNSLPINVSFFYETMTQLIRAQYTRKPEKSRLFISSQRMQIG